MAHENNGSSFDVPIGMLGTNREFATDYDYFKLFSVSESIWSKKKNQNYRVEMKKCGKKFEKKIFKRVSKNKV